MRLPSSSAVSQQLDRAWHDPWRVSAHDTWCGHRKDVVAGAAESAAAAAAVFWDEAKTLLERLPRGGLNIAHEAVVRQVKRRVIDALISLCDVGTDIVTLGQYLRPTRRHLQVARLVEPDTFAALADDARTLGFVVAAGPLVRSSYRAASLAHAARAKNSASTLTDDE
jgi:hypothetical protein